MAIIYPASMMMIIVVVSLSCPVLAFHHHALPFRSEWTEASGRTVLAAKGFGASSPSNRSTTKSKEIKKIRIKDIEKQLKQKYGGTTPEAIAKGTQASMEAALQSLPAHVQSAAHLYQTIRKWDVYYNRLSILEQSSAIFVDHDQQIHVQRARDEYNRLCASHPHDVSDHHMHQLYQRLTWDAAADAKAARVALSGGTMKDDVKRRIQTVRKKS